MGTMGTTGPLSGSLRERSRAAGAAIDARRRRGRMAIARSSWRGGRRCRRRRRRTRRRGVFAPSVALEETLTNNVNLASINAGAGDLVTQITPALGITRKSAHASLDGSIAAAHPALCEHRAPRTIGSTRRSNLARQCRAGRKIPVLRRGRGQRLAAVPFAVWRAPAEPRQRDENRYTSQTYRISPYIKGDAPDKINYELRVDNIWTRLNNAPTSFDGIPISTDEFVHQPGIGRITAIRSPSVGSSTTTGETFASRIRRPQLTELGRLRLLYQVDPSCRFGLSGGYEHNAFPFTSYDGRDLWRRLQWRSDARSILRGLLGVPVSSARRICSRSIIARPFPS